MAMEIERKSGVKNIAYRGIIFNLTSIHLLDSTTAGSALMYLKYFSRSSLVLLTLLSAVGTRAEVAIILLTFS